MTSSRCIFVTAEGFPPTVFDSQVLDRLEALDHAGLPFDLLVFERALAAPREVDAKRERARAAMARLSGRLSYGVYGTSFLPFDTGPARLQAELMLRRRGLGRESAVLIHARTATAMRIVGSLKATFPRAKLVYDVRGDSAAELRLHGHTSRWQRYKNRRLLSIHDASVRRADALLAVSNPLKNKIAAEDGFDPRRIMVVPTTASTEKFRIGDSVRDRRRAEIGVAPSRFVLVYAGSLAAYQWLDRVVALSAALMSVADVHLLLVTPDPGRVTELARRALPADRITALRAPHDEVAEWLNAADAGWLIREKGPVNRVAAPTKFAEHLMCGLPMIMSTEIGDYSDLAAAENLGLVLTEETPDAIRAGFPRLQALARERGRISSFARERLSHRAFAPRLVEFYRRVLAS